MTAEALAIATGCLAALVLGLGIWMAILQRRLAAVHAQNDRLRAGVEGERLDDLLEAHIAAAQRAAEEARSAREHCAALAAQVQQSFQRCAVVRFNPFGDTGGDQSFAIAVLNLDGDGFVLSTLHGRAGTRIYAKPVRGNTSRYQLSDEEERALTEARMSGVTPAP